MGKIDKLVQLEDWRDQWNHGDEFYVPELFEMVEDLLSANARMREDAANSYVSHMRIVKQLEAQNRALTEQLTKIELTKPIQLTIPTRTVITEHAKEWLRQIYSQTENGETKNENPES